MEQKINLDVFKNTSGYVHVYTQMPVHVNGNQLQSQIQDSYCVFFYHKVSEPSNTGNTVSSFSGECIILFYLLSVASEFL